MTRIWIWTLLLCAGFLLAGLLLQRCRDKAEHRRTGRGRWRTEAMLPPAVLPDTVRTARIAPLAARGLVAVPAAITVSTVPDTALRRVMERGIIITGIERRRPLRRGLAQRLRIKPRPADSLIIQAITPKGIMVENRYAWEVAAGGEWRIDSAGRLRLDPLLRGRQARRQRRKARTRNALRTAGATAAAVLMFFFVTR